MATTTPNLGLKKPNVTDKVNVSDLNGNADLLDAIIGRLSNLNTTQKDSLVAAINEALTSAGTAAGFGNPVATVDGNTGTPSVEVTASGPDTAKVFTFTFKNLKGAKNVLMFILPVLLGLCCTMAPALAEVVWFSGSPVISWLFVGMFEIRLTFVLVALNHVNLATVGKK